MSKQITLQYCGMEGTGETVTKAKQDAARKIEAMLAADYTPKVVAYKGNAFLIWREPTPYGHISIQSCRIMEKGEMVAPLSRGSTTHGGARDVADVVSQYMLHLAQEAWDGQEEQSEFLRLRPDLQREFTSWCQWQKRYKEARDKGMSDTAAHYIACGRPDLVEKCGRPGEEDTHATA
jgi:hypothetical protein